MLFKQTLEVQEARSSDDGRRPKPPVPRDCVRSSFEAAANARGAFSLGSALSWTYFRHIGGELLITSPWPCSAMTRSSKGWKPSCRRRPSRARARTRSMRMSILAWFARFRVLSRSCSSVLSTRQTAGLLRLSAGSATPSPATRCRRRPWCSWRVSRPV